MAALNNVLKESINLEQIILLALNFVIVKVVAKDKRMKKFILNIHSYIYRVFCCLACEDFIFVLNI